MRLLIFLLFDFLLLINGLVIQAQTELVLRDIFIDGNKVTKTHIILRELEFHQGDTIAKKLLPSLIEKSKENLKNLSIFNFQDIKVLTVEGGELSLLVQVTERWYIFPLPYAQVADRNLNAWYARDDKWRHLNYGAWLFWKNFRGRAETINFLFKTGFDQHYQLNYEIPYLNKHKTLGLNLGATYIRSHQINAYTIENKDVYYPVFQRKGEFAKRMKVFYTQVVFRKNIHSKHLFGVSYADYLFSDSLLILNPKFSFEGKNRNQFVSLSYVFKYDYRDYIHYPLKGYYLDLSLKKRGLGIMLPRENGSTELGFNARKFWQLNQKFYYATAVNGFHSFGANTPYYLSPELGEMHHLVRGYEDFTIRGQSFFLFKNNFKYELLKPTTYYFKGVKEEFGKVHYALYVNVFSDFGYMKNSFNPLSNTMGDQWLYGGGIGFDIVTYYDKVMRLEFSYHRNGYWGFYVHYIPSI